MAVSSNIHDLRYEIGHLQREIEFRAEQDDQDVERSGSAKKSPRRSCQATVKTDPLATGKLTPLSREESAR